jgi:hypothetical protein
MFYFEMCLSAIHDVQHDWQANRIINRLVQANNCVSG